MSLLILTCLFGCGGSKSRRGRCPVRHKDECGAEAGCPRNEGRRTYYHSDCTTTESGCDQRYCVGEEGAQVMALSGDGM